MWLDVVAYKTNEERNGVFIKIEEDWTKYLGLKRNIEVIQMLH